MCRRLATLALLTNDQVYLANVNRFVEVAEELLYLLLCTTFEVVMGVNDGINRLVGNPAKYRQDLCTNLYGLGQVGDNNTIIIGLVNAQP